MGKKLVTKSIGSITCSGKIDIQDLMNKVENKLVVLRWDLDRIIYVEWQVTDESGLGNP